MNPNKNPEFVDAFATAFGGKQVGVIVHGRGINHHHFAEEAEKNGLCVVELEDHTRLYKLPIQP